MAPRYLSQLIERYQPLRVLRSQDAALLVERNTTVRYGDRSFYAAAPKLWNTLPIHLRKADNLATFKGL